MHVHIQINYKPCMLTMVPAAARAPVFLTHESTHVVALGRDISLHKVTSITLEDTASWHDSMNYIPV